MGFSDLYGVKETFEVDFGGGADGDALPATFTLTGTITTPRDYDQAGDGLRALAPTYPGGVSGSAYYTEYTLTQTQYYRVTWYFTISTYRATPPATGNSMFLAVASSVGGALHSFQRPRYSTASAPAPITGPADLFSYWMGGVESYVPASWSLTPGDTYCAGIEKLGTTLNYFWNPTVGGGPDGFTLLASGPIALTPSASGLLMFNSSWNAVGAADYTGFKNVLVEELEPEYVGGGGGAPQGNDSSLPPAGGDPSMPGGFSPLDLASSDVARGGLSLADLLERRDYQRYKTFRSMADTFQHLRVGA